MSTWRLCQTCVSVCGSCVIRVFRIIPATATDTATAKSSPLKTKSGFDCSLVGAAEDPYMLSMPSALRLKSAAERNSLLMGYLGQRSGNWLSDYQVQAEILVVQPIDGQGLV